MTFLNIKKFFYFEGFPCGVINKILKRSAWWSAQLVIFFRVLSLGYNLVLC